MKNEVTSDQTAFQAFAGDIIERVILLADMAEIKVDVLYCLQQVPGPDPREELAYLLSHGENDVFLATDDRGRMWYCEGPNRCARQITPEFDFPAMTRSLLEVLNCPMPGLEYFPRH